MLYSLKNHVRWNVLFSFHNKQPSRRPVPVYEAPADWGLTEAQARERAEAGWANLPVDPPGKTVGQIIISNVFTYFNLVFLVLGVLLATVQSWNNLSFLLVVLWNTLIGIVQELRSKRELDRLNLLTAQRCAVVRNGQERQVPTEALVRDDVVIFRGGDQVCADAVVLRGECTVNEALVTGESDELRKAMGDQLLSGSFLVNGEVRVRLTAVGADAYAGRLTQEAKRDGKQREPEMMRALSQLVKWIGILLLPLGAALLYKDMAWRHIPYWEAIVSTVGALVGMIPEGLYLLTSLALVSSVLRLARKHTLVHELRSIETLARVDTVCVDKTGTITEPEMSLAGLTPLGDVEEAELRGLMADYARAAGPENDTMRALLATAEERQPRAVAQRLPFSSARKYGGLRFTDGECLFLGAPELLLGPRIAEYRSQMDAAAERGNRLLLLCRRKDAAPLEAPPEPDTLAPLGLAELRNPIRPAAAETFRFFSQEGVGIKVISGDNPLTVSRVARQAGIPGAERCLDARELSEDALERAVEQNTVFGRVTPEQKRRLLLALKRSGHTVAMTGDGVNDVLALKEADCSVAMASGSDAAGQVSDLVLLRNDFSVMPEVVAEGRRVINNIQRSAALFLVKNIFSFLVALTGLLFRLPYPLAPVQISLVGMLTIGLPAFVLAMEPNHSLVKGHFMRNVLSRAVAPALTDYVLVLSVLLLGGRLGLAQSQAATVCVYVMSAVGFWVVAGLCRPFNRIRAALLAVMLLGFAGAVLVLPGWFQIAPLQGSALALLAALLVLSLPLLLLLTWFWARLNRAFENRPRRSQTE